MSDSTGRKRRWWWPFGRKRRAAQEPAEAAPTQAAEQAPAEPDVDDDAPLTNADGIPLPEMPAAIAPSPTDSMDEDDAPAPDTLPAADPPVAAVDVETPEPTPGPTSEEPDPALAYQEEDEDIAAAAAAKVREAERNALRSSTAPDPVRKELGAQTLPQELGEDAPHGAELPEDTKAVIDQAQAILDNLPGRIAPDRD